MIGHPALAYPKFVPKVCSPSIPCQSKKQIDDFFPSGTCLAAAAKFLWRYSHTAAVSLSDLDIKYKWQFILSISLQMFKSSVSKWYETDTQQYLCFCLKVQQIKRQYANRCFQGRQVTLLKRLCCWSQRKVQATWASEINWSCVSCWDLCHGPPSLSIIEHNTSERYICPKSMKSQCFPAVFVLHGIDFHVQCHSSKSISSTSWGTLHFTGQQRSCEVAPTLRQFHFQTSVSSIIGSSSSLPHFRCSSNYFLLTYIMPNEWCQIDGNQWWTRIVFFPAFRSNTINTAKSNKSSKAAKSPCWKGSLAAFK